MVSTRCRTNVCGMVPLCVICCHRQITVTVIMDLLWVWTCISMWVLDFELCTLISWTLLLGIEDLLCITQSYRLLSDIVVSCMFSACYRLSVSLMHVLDVYQTLLTWVLVLLVFIHYVSACYRLVIIPSALIKLTYELMNLADS